MSEFGIWFAAVVMIITNIGSSIGVIKYFNSRFQKMYEDFDVYKKDVDTIYVRRDICHVMHEQTASNVSGLELRINSRFDKLETKFDKLMDILQEKHDNS